MVNRLRNIVQLLLVISEKAVEGSDWGCSVRTVTMPLAKELLLPLAREEQRKHKLKRLVQHPNSYFMDVKCPGCYRITTVFSHAQTVVVCSGCSTVLCQSTGGRARLTEERSIEALLLQPVLLFHYRLFLPKKTAVEWGLISSLKKGMWLFILK